MVESGVKVLQVVNAFRLSPCRKDPGNLHQNCPPDVVWSGGLRNYPDNTCILLARSPCGRHSLRKQGPSIASFRSWYIYRFPYFFLCLAYGGFLGVRVSDHRVWLG